MKNHGPKFVRKYEAVIAALLTQRTTEEAARVSGVSHSTLLRWMKLKTSTASTGPLAAQPSGSLSRAYNRLAALP